jgi:hypothetical protein
VGFGGLPLNFTWTYVPGGAGGRKAQRCVPHTRCVAGGAGCRGKSWLAPHSTGSAIAEKWSPDPDPHIPGGDSGGDVGRPGQVGAAMLRLPVPKVGSGVVRIPHRLPPPPVIGKRRNPVAGAPQAQH